MRFAAWFSLFVGGMMFAQWGMFIATGQVPEFQTEPYRIAFHLAGETMTAVALIVAGIGLLRRKLWGKSAFLVASGMLLYTIVVSPGYFAQQGQWVFVVMFAVIVACTLVSLRLVLRGSPEN